VPGRLNCLTEKGKRNSEGGVVLVHKTVAFPLFAWTRRPRRLVERTSKTPHTPPLPPTISATAALTRSAPSLPSRPHSSPAHSSAAAARGKSPTGEKAAVSVPSGSGWGEGVRRAARPGGAARPQRSGLGPRALPVSGRLTPGVAFGWSVPDAGRGIPNPRAPAILDAGPRRRGRRRRRRRGPGT
jgi:hypothetical protein